MTTDAITKKGGTHGGRYPMVNTADAGSHGRRSMVNAHDGAQHGEHTYRSTIPPDLGAAIGRARRRLGWSYRRAGREVGVVPATLWYLEHGQRAPSLATAQRVAQVYQLDPDPARRLVAVASHGTGYDWKGAPWD